MIKDKLESILKEKFPNASITIENFSGHHAGHAHAHEDSHYSVSMRWSGFADMTTVNAHKAVMSAAKPLFEEGLHALQLDLKA